MTGETAQCFHGERRTPRLAGKRGRRMPMIVRDGSMVAGPSREQRRPRKAFAARRRNVLYKGCVKSILGCRMDGEVGKLGGRG